MRKRKRTGNGLLIAVLLVGAVGLVLWMLRGPKAVGTPQQKVLAAPQGSYRNTEEWEILWSKDGLPVKVTIHRKAVRGG